MSKMSQFRSIVAILAGWVSFAAAFTNPIRTGSDPQMVYTGGRYYMTYTTWEDVRITSAQTIDGLKTSEEHIVWADKSDPDRSCNFWAPEMHQVGDKWYVYFTASICNSDWGEVLPSLRVYVLEGGTENPLSGDYKMLGSIVPPNFDHGMLDASLFEIDGINYFLYSSAINGGGTPSGAASLFISKLLSANETGDATMIAEPEYDWEQEDSPVLEGPYGIKSPEGQTFVAYSADSCNTPAYKLGLLELNKGADPMKAESWIKYPEPIFETGNGLYGTGHNAFFKSPDGQEDWQVFHANVRPTDGCSSTRQAFIQPVTWTDGRPDLGDPMPVGTEIEPPSGGCKKRSK